MTKRLPFWRDNRATAAAELALVMPFMLALMFGSMEIGNYFFDQHKLVKQVRDGARYASRLSLDAAYACPGTVFADANAETMIEHVTKTGTVDGTGEYRLPVATWAATCAGAPEALAVTVRCVSATNYKGIYTGLDGDIPVVKVSAALQYNSILGTMGFNTTGLCLRAESEVAVAGL